jgi:DNA-binding NarL/FixJ family response regulator
MRLVGKRHVVLVDDHDGVRQELRRILQDYPDVVVVAEAADGAQAVAATERLKPDVVIIDIHMPRMNGIEATSRIKRLSPNTIVIGISSDPAPHIHEAVKHSGAEVLIPKEEVYGKLYDVMKALCPPPGS